MTQTYNYDAHAVIKLSFHSQLLPFFQMIIPGELRLLTFLYFVCPTISLPTGIMKTVGEQHFQFSDDVLGTWSKADINQREAVVTTLQFPRGFNCSVYHFKDDMKKVFEDFIEREVFEDDFIFISTENFLFDEDGEDQSGLYSFDPDLQSNKTFAFLKSDFEGEYKFLPIRLEQFEALYQLGERELLMEGDSYVKSKPRDIKLQLNVSNDCILHLTDVGGPEEIVTFAESKLKDTILSHLVMVLHNIFLEVKEKTGKMWKDSSFDRSCFVDLETIRHRRYSAPFEILECCHYSFGKLSDKADRALPLECETMHEAVGSVQAWVYCITTIIFIFAPILVSSTPSKPRAYKTLRSTLGKSETVESRLSSSSVSEESESSVSPRNDMILSTNLKEPAEISDNKAKPETEVLVHDRAVDMSNAADERALPKLGVNEGVNSKVLHSHKTLTIQQGKPCYLGILCNPCSDSEKCQAGIYLGQIPRCLTLLILAEDFQQN